MRKVKFMEYLSDDVIRENHHLKDQLIVLRKTLKQYESQMVKELQNAAAALRITESFCNFLTPEECLSRFLELVHESIEKSAGLDRQLQRTELSNSSLRGKLDQQRTLIAQHQQTIEAQASTITEQQRQINALKSALEQLSSKHLEKQANYLEDIGKLKTELETITRNLHIKYTTEKQVDLERSNRSIIQFRQKMERQFSRHEKILRAEVEKKDRALKSVLFTINSLLGLDGKSGEDILKKAKSRKYKQELREDDAKDEKDRALQRESSKFFPSQDQLTLLESIIQPFSEHSALNDKISELRQEIVTLRESKSSMQTALISARNTVSEVQTQMSILNSQRSLLDEKNHALFEEHEALLDSYEKCKKELGDLESYYERKWNHEFNNVRDNLQKKYNDKVQMEEQNYQKKLHILETERIAIIQQRKRMEEETKRYENQKIDMQISLSRQKQLTQQCEQELRKLRMSLTQIDQLHNEDIYSHEHRFLCWKHQMQEQIDSLGQTVSQLQQKLRKTQEMHEESVNNIHKTNIDSTISIKEEFKSYYASITKEKETKIEELCTEIESHKQALSRMQENVGIQISQAENKCNKKHEEAINRIKIDFYEKKQKMNNKIISIELKNQKFRNKADQEKEALMSQIKELQAMLAEKEKALAESQKQLGKAHALREGSEFKIKDQFQIIAKDRDEKESLNVLLRSQQKQIKDLNSQISELLGSKAAWKSEIHKTKEEMKENLKQIKKIYENRMSFYRSRIWELQEIVGLGWMSMRELNKIRELTKEKRNLEEALNQKEAQNLILQQVKLYYENKARETDIKLGLDYQLKPLKEKRQQILKRPGLKNQNMHSIKMQVIENNSNFEGEEFYSVKKALRENKSMRKSAHSRSTILHSQAQQKQTKTSNKDGRQSFKNERVNSSLT